MTVETLRFQAEVQQLLNLMIHSLYSNKEIFLRELISNGSDALDRLRFEEVTNQNLIPSSHENGVRVTPLPDSTRLVIEDNGIGMTRDELVANLGTIASSGTKKFLEAMSESDRKDANLIGQFGVGFYSAFMVAEKVIVETRSARTGEAWRWESTGDGTFTLDVSPRQDRGTRIELVLKADEKEFVEDWRLRGIIHKYSDFVTYPIFMIDKEGKQERVNKTTPVWARNKRENKPEDYNELYKQISRDFTDPLFYEHISAEGLIPFQAVVFVPGQAPWDLYTRDAHGLHLYVKRVSVIEKAKELLPEYLRFVAGVVETDELPLNVSREILQQNSKVTTIRKQIVKKVLGTLANAAENDKEKFFKFYEVFGPVLKEGFHFDRDNHEALAEIVRFRSSRTGADGWVSLKEYADRKAENQKEIYYITAPSYEVASRSPHVEALRARDIEVLYLVDPIDEWFSMDYTKYKEMNLKSIAKGDLDLRGVGKEPNDDQADKSEVPAAELAGLLEVLRSRLSDDVKDVKVSKRMTDSACCLVVDEHAMTAQMERLMKLSNKEFQGSKKILEVNPSHPLIKNLANLKQKGSTDEQMSLWVDVLYNTALLAEGSPLKNPGDFARRVTQIMQQVSNPS